MIAAHLARDVVLPLIEQETAAVRVAYKEAEANEDRLERLLVSLLADLTELADEYQALGASGNGAEWFSVARQVRNLAKYAPDTTTTEPVEPDPFTDNDVDAQEQP